VLSQPDLIPKSSGSVNPKFDALFLRNILNSNGEEWRKFRHALSDPFAFDAVHGWVEDFVFYANRLMHIWHDKVTQGESIVDLLQWLPVFTLDVLGKTVFSYDFNAINAANDENLQALRYVLQAFESKITIFFIIVEAITRMQVNKTFHRQCDKLHDFIAGIMEQKKNNPSNPSKHAYVDIVDTMIRAGFTTEEIVSNAFILFIAGHDTTATALAWLMYHLGTHPACMDKAVLEVEQQLHGQAATYAHMKELSYIKLLVKENMRLQPPAALLISRFANENLEFDGHVIPKGTTVGVDIKTIHRHPSFYENADDFNPDRFDSSKKQQTHPFAYLPFSLKSRACLGNQFAVVEQVMFMATLLQHFKWTVKEFSYKPVGMGTDNKPTTVTVMLSAL
jgi:cytochrome P450